FTTFRSRPVPAPAGRERMAPVIFVSSGRSAAPLMAEVSAALRSERRNTRLAARAESVTAALVAFASCPTDAVSGVRAALATTSEGVCAATGAADSPMAHPTAMPMLAFRRQPEPCVELAFELSMPRGRADGRKGSHRVSADRSRPTATLRTLRFYRSRPLRAIEMFRRHVRPRQTDGGGAPAPPPSFRFETVRAYQSSPRPPRPRSR